MDHTTFTPPEAATFHREAKERKERQVVTMTMEQILAGAYQNTPEWQMGVAACIEGFKEDWNEDLTPEQVIKNMETLFTPEERQNTTEVLLIEGGKEIVGYIDVTCVKVGELNDLPEEYLEDDADPKEAEKISKTILKELKKIGLKEDDLVADLNEATLRKKYRGQAANLLELYQGVITSGSLDKASHVYFWTRAKGAMTKMFQILERLGIKEFLRLDDENSNVFYCVEKNKLMAAVGQAIEVYYATNIKPKV